jgi:transposase-like protein
MEAAMDTHLAQLMGLVASLDAEDFQVLEAVVSKRQCCDRLGIGTIDEAAALYRPNPKCPSCGSDPFKNGHTPAGHQRFLCPSCNKGYSALTGTVLEFCKKDLPTWADFITLMCYNSPLDLAVELCDITHGTAFEWRHRVFATINGYQDRLKLRDRIWIDETYVPDSALLRGPDWKPKRGLSKEQKCIALAIDVHKSAVAIICGNGKPSAKRIKDALLSHIAEGSVVVHDKEKAHNSLVKAAKCTDEAYKADTKNPAYLEGMALMNNYCSWIKRFLWRFPGMKAKNLQSYLNWFTYLFRVKRDEEKWPKTERVIRHLLMTDSYFRS